MPVDTAQLERLRDLMQQRCFQYGDFTLTSGGKSKFYFNGKLVTLRPSSAELIGEALIDVVLASGADAVGGPALGAVPIAMAVGAAGLTRNRDLPVYVVRMEQKQHGAKDLIAEPYSDEGGPVVTKGRSVAIVERHEGGADTLRAEGYEVVSLFRADEDGQLSVNEAYVERLSAL